MWRARASCADQSACATWRPLDGDHQNDAHMPMMCNFAILGARGDDDYLVDPVADIDTVRFAAVGPDGAL
jgi:hypothetical protein